MLVSLIVMRLALASSTGGDSAATSPGSVVATGDGFTVTAERLRERIAEQPPYLRARYETLERRREFLQSLIRFEVLAREAERRGLSKDPVVLEAFRKVMVQRLVQQQIEDGRGLPPVSDAEIERYYQDHAAQFQRPRRVRTSVIVLSAPTGSPSRARKLAAARKALDRVRKEPAAFGALAAKLSEHGSTDVQGDLGWKTPEDLEKIYGKELAEGLAAVKQGEATLIEGPGAIYVARAEQIQEAVQQPLEQVKPQIASRLTREAKSRQFDRWVEELTASAKVTIDEEALGQIEIPPPGTPADAAPAAP